MELTKEQKAIIEETITNKNGIYGISAAAGSGKSFTIFKAIDYIKEHEPNAKILYLVFNKRNQQEAEQKLRKYFCWSQPVNVKTAHSYAHNKLTKVIGEFTVLTALDWNIIQDVKAEYKYNPEIKYSKKRPFLWLHDAYCSSKKILDTFCEDMIAHWDDDYNGPDKPSNITITTSKGYKKMVYGIPVDGYSYITEAHIDAFKEVMNRHIKAKLYTHGMYLKSAAYSKKTGGDKYDYVFFDEAQDASYFMLKLLKKQDIRKLYYVGDERQAIYQFGCNVNVFKTIAFDKEYKLTTSFRFGKDIADLATHILQLSSNHEVHGTEQTHETDPYSIARLYRTNATLFQEALDLAYNAKLLGTSLKIDLLKSNEDASAINELLSFLKLYYKYNKYSYYAKQKSIFPEFVCSSLSEFEKSLERGDNFFDIYNDQYDFLSDNIHIMFNYAQKEENFIEKYIAYRDCLENIDPNASKIVFCTMHRSKGLEWDNVTIAEPTRLYYKDKEGVLRRNPEYLQELNLAYVGVTRARKTLNAEILKHELSDEQGSFENLCYSIKEGKNTYEPIIPKRHEHYDESWSTPTYQSNNPDDLCSTYYDPFWSKMLDTSDVFDAGDLC